MDDQKPKPKPRKKIGKRKHLPNPKALVDPSKAPGTPGRELAPPSVMVKLRDEAALTFIRDPDRCTVRQIKERPEFSEVGYNTLYKWSQDDKWADRRKEFWDQVYGVVLDKSASAMVKDRVEKINTMKRLYDESLELLDKKKNEIPEVKSYEGMLKALVALDKHVAEQTAFVMNTLEPQVAKDKPDAEDTTTRIQHNFSAEEKREIAMQIIRKRRDETRKAANALKDSEVVDSEFEVIDEDG